MIWIKLIFMLLVTVICLSIAAAPEAFMYWIWHLVAPTEGWEKIALVFIFSLGGITVTLLAWFLAGAAWFTCLVSTLETRW